jgi:hypothetical protein
MTARCRLGVLVAAWIVGLLAAPAAGEAGIVGPEFTLAGVEAVPLPLTVIIDPVTEAKMYAIPDIPPPEVRIWNLAKDGTLTDAGSIPLPAGLIPVGLWFDFDGYLNIVTRQGRTFSYCPDCRTLKETTRLPSGAEFPSDAAAGYETNVLSEYGSETGTSGSLWYGTNFESELALTDARAGAVDFVTGYRKLKMMRISGGFLSYAEQTDTLLQFKDASPPTQFRAFQGPPGVGVLGGLAVSPLNLTPSFTLPATLPAFVSSPTAGTPNSGNVYYSTDWSIRGSDASWKPLSATPLGVPASLDFGCRIGAVADYSNDQISVFRIIPPKDTECESGFDLLVEALPGRKELTLGESIKAYVDAGGDASALFNLREHRKGSATGKATNKVRAHTTVELKAGRVTKAELKFSSAETAAVNEALAHGGKLKGETTVAVKDKAGHKIKLTQPLTLKAAKAGEGLKLKAG